MITFPAKFEAELQKQPNSPAFIVKMTSTGTISHEETLQADWNASPDKSSDIDLTTSAGDILLPAYVLSQVTSNGEVTIHGFYGERICQKFKTGNTASGPSVAKFTFKARYPLGAGTLPVSFSIFAHNAGTNHPNFSAMIGNWQTNVTLPATAQVFTVVAPTAIVLSANTYYWVTASPDYYTDVEMAFSWQTTNPYADGFAVVNYDDYTSFSDYASNDFYFKLEGYYSNKYLVTANMDLGSTPADPGEWRFSTLLPSATAVVFIAWSSATGAFAGEETALGTVTDVQAISDLKRYYRVKATLTTTGQYTPSVRSIMAYFPIYLSVADHPRFGYEPSVSDVSTLQTTIDMFRASTIGQVSVKLALTKQISNYLKSEYPKNKEVRVLMGFIADGFAEADFVNYYRGMVSDWSLSNKDEVTLKLRDFHGSWQDVMVPAKWQTVSDDVTFTAQHHTDTIISLAKGYIGTADRYLDQDSINTVKIATDGWTITRTLTGKTFDAKALMEELRILLGAFFIPNADGKVKLKRWDASEAAILDLTETEIQDLTYQSNADNLINKTYIYFNHDGTTGTDQKNFAALDINTDSTSQSNWGETKTKEVKDYWTKTAQASQLADLSNKIIARFKNIPDILQFSLDLRFMALEVGDMVSITHRRVPSTDLTGISGVKYQVVNKDLDFKKDRVKLKVLRAS